MVSQGLPHLKMTLPRRYLLEINPVGINTYRVLYKASHHGYLTYLNTT